jgi:hypothetical protein
MVYGLAFLNVLYASDSQEHQNGSYSDDWQQYFKVVSGKAKPSAIELPLLLYLLPNQGENGSNSSLINILVEKATSEGIKGIEGIVIGDAVPAREGGYVVGPQNKA